MEEKTEKTCEEMQLDFAFVAEMVKAPVTIASTPRPERAPRFGRSRRLEKTLVTAQSVLLEASLEELDEQLFLLLEFCEAALTRALDLASLRKEVLFSAEEYRSLRGIGQAQWLLTEASVKREMQAEAGKGKKGKKRTGNE